MKRFWIALGMAVAVCCATLGITTLVSQMHTEEKMEETSLLQSLQTVTLPAPPEKSDLQPQEEPQQETAAKSEEALPQGALAGRIICIDPGHCISSAGGKERMSPLSDEMKSAIVSGASGRNQTEEALNLAVGLRLRDLLEAQGAQVVMTRTVSEIDLTNIQRAEIANDAGADVCIRIHADGVDDSRVHGVSVLIPAGAFLGTPEIAAPSAQLGQIMVDCVAQETGAKNRGTTERTDLTGFNWSKVPVVLLEMGFLSNPEEDAAMETEAYQQKIAQGVTNALLQWFAAT